jgi:hypothetical protein
VDVIEWPPVAGEQAAFRNATDVPKRHSGGTTLERGRGVPRFASTSAQLF